MLRIRTLAFIGLGLAFSPFILAALFFVGVFALGMVVGCARIITSGG